jgi:hypothetical protein
MEAWGRNLMLSTFGKGEGKHGKQKRRWAIGYPSAITEAFTKSSAINCP